MQSFAYVRPRSLRQAVDLLAKPGALAHAGGTDLLGCLRDGAVSAATVVSLAELAELRRLTLGDDGGLRLGALVTIDEIAGDERVRTGFPVLAEAAVEIASPQLRNQGTIGGNLCQRPRCWYYRGDFHCLKKGGDRCFAASGENVYHCIFGGGPCYIVHPSDGAPALLALDAEVRIEGSGGSRWLDLASFYHLPVDDVESETVLQTEHSGEIVTEIRVPPLPPGTRSRYRKVRARRVWDFALASSALALTFDGERVSRARVVLGGVAPIPWRLPAVEEALVGAPLSAEAIDAAADLAVADAEPLSQNAYKVDLVRGLLRDELATLAAG